MDKQLSHLQPRSAIVPKLSPVAKYVKKYTKLVKHCPRGFQNYEIVNICQNMLPQCPKIHQSEVSMDRILWICNQDLQVSLICHQWPNMWKNYLRFIKNPPQGGQNYTIVYICKNMLSHCPKIH